MWLEGGESGWEYYIERQIYRSSGGRGPGVAISGAVFGWKNTGEAYDKFLLNVC